MRKKIIAGNWKMNGTLKETEKIVTGLREILSGENLEKSVVVCPPFTALRYAGRLLSGSNISLGAQNMFYEAKGAFTGEISGEMLVELGCRYVILGHSERRSHFGESNELIGKKVKRAIENKLTPILCVGESLEEREEGITTDVVKEQLSGSLKDLSSEEVSGLVVAYEPVWAIGTGKNATPEEANVVHQFIRDYFTGEYSETVGENLTIQYGGSVNSDNAASLLAMPDIDGALVGGASLKVESFAAILLA